MDQSQLHWWRWARAVLALVLACFLAGKVIKAAWSTILDTSAFPPVPRAVRNTEEMIFGLVYTLVSLGFIYTGLWEAAVVRGCGVAPSFVCPGFPLHPLKKLDIARWTRTK